MYELAIVGIGKWGKKLLHEFEKNSTVSTCHTTGARSNLKWLKKNYPKIKFVPKFQNVLENTKINSIIIATPIKTHFNLAIRSLNAGKNVFVEKPISEDPKQARQLIKIAKKNKLCLFVGHEFLYHPIIKKIKLIDKNDPIRNIIFYWSKLGTFNENIILNLLSHELSIILEVFGKPQKVTILEKIGFVSNINIMSVKLTFSNRRKCFIHINRIANFKNKSVTFLTKEKCYIWENEKLLEFKKEKNLFNVIYNSKKSALSIQCKTFLKDIKLKEKNYSNPHKALEVIEIITKHLISKNV